MQSLPAVTHTEERDVPFEIDSVAFDRLITELSAVFKDYKDIYNSSVMLNGLEIDHLPVDDRGSTIEEARRGLYLLSLVVVSVVMMVRT